MLDTMNPTSISQGSIITSCRAARYDGLSVYGLIITARCDIEHSKVAIYNYLPISRLEDWLLLDGAEIIADRAIASLNGVMKSCLAQSGRPKDLLEYVERDLILQELKKDEHKNSTNIYEQFSEAYLNYELCKSVFDEIDRELRANVLKKNGKMCSSLMKELREHRLSDFHYLPRVISDQQPTGYVANLREVRNISSLTARLVENGLEPSEFGASSKVGRAVRSDLDFSHPDHTFAMPISQIKSPEIEFVLQRFSNLFGRIGVTDFNRDEIEMSEGILERILEPEQ